VSSPVQVKVFELHQHAQQQPAIVRQNDPYAHYPAILRAYPETRSEMLPDLSSSAAHLSCPVSVGSVVLVLFVRAVEPQMPHADLVLLQIRRELEVAPALALCYDPRAQAVFAEDPAIVRSWSDCAMSHSLLYVQALLVRQ
jgi:hypothetical protein